MSRLWIEHRSDVRSGNGHGASERAEVNVYWGSASDSKLAGRLAVEWRKGEGPPRVYFQRGLSTINEEVE